MPFSIFESPVVKQCVRNSLIAIRKLHTPVLSKEILDIFEPTDGQVFIDMTFGGGGHTRHLLGSAANIKVYALDRDPVAHNIAQELAKSHYDRVIPLLGKFSDLPNLLHHHNVQQNSIDGILFDLGCSSMQFDEAYRGFSISEDGPLDMRMGGNQEPKSLTAAEVLATIEEHDLARILAVYGEEKQAKKIARAVIETRYTFRKLHTTKQLAELVAAILDQDSRMDKLQRPSHIATKTFQALRIFVNNELNELNYGLLVAHKYMKINGKIVVLSFHSLEDRIVKSHLNTNITLNLDKEDRLKYTDYSHWYDEKSILSLKSDKWKPLLKHVLVPTEEEVQQNPRSRSAKLRAAVKIK